VSNTLGTAPHNLLSRLGAIDDRTAFYLLMFFGALVIGLVLATPFAFWKHGDNAYVVIAIATGLAALGAAIVAEHASPARALWLIFAVAVLSRLFMLLLDPLLSTDIYRYIWDGKVQAAGINPYRYVPADPALASLRDTVIYPNINRADYAVTIYPPVAQMFFFLVTRFGESVTTMKVALLACEGVTVTMILLLLRQLARPATRIVAYAWHPLPMWEIANSGHIDAFMLALMMLGLWLALTGRPLRGAASIALAALVKPFALLALPATWRPSWRPWDWKAPIIVSAIMVLCYAPYLSVGWGVFGSLTGYLNEEQYSSGALVWPLAAIRWIAGTFRGDLAIYFAASACAVTAMALVAAWRKERPAEVCLHDINRLLLAFMFLLSPNYPWYFLILTPFVALVGGAPVWVFTVGAVLLQDELRSDPYVPMLMRKSVLYGVFLIACTYPFLRVWLNSARSKDASDGTAANR
jgi:alpha-1,6-mannosyltransferase